ncbi:MAG: hypothetical protein KUG77_09400 [Nannocystaceae bacterium]|nr:hypothetical protein [Nannocystaceae bacterium]
MTVEGNLSAQGEELGSWDLDPGICIGGFRQEIDVSSHDGERCVRFVDDAELGPIIVAFIPGTLDGFVFTEDDCEEFYVRLDRTVDHKGLLYNHGDEMVLDRTSENGTISGRVGLPDWFLPAPTRRSIFLWVQQPPCCSGRPRRPRNQCGPSPGTRPTAA